MYLGTLAPLREEIEALVDHAQQLSRERLNTTPGRDRLAAIYGVLAFPEYLRALARFDRHEQELHRWRIADDDQKARMVPPAPALIGFILRGRSRARTPDEAGWRAYLGEIAPGFAEKLASMYRPSAFPEVHRNRHTLVVAPTGHGKSELLKALVWHYVQHPGAAVIVLDPGGDMSRQIARWPELLRSERLVYVEPELRPGYTVGINPFAGGTLLDERGRSAVAGIIAQTLGDLTADLSPNMMTLTRYCATVLLGVPGATLRDLQLLIQKPEQRGKTVRSFAFDDDEPDPYEDRRQEIGQAAVHHENLDVRRFFRIDFDSPEYLGTRGWLGTRLKGIGAKVDLRRALFGPDTLKLEQAMDAGKIVVVNVNRFGDASERGDVGRLLVGLVAAIGGRRGQWGDASRRPVHLIVDEATEVVSPQMVVILEQLRKFGIHLTLAQQVGGRAFTTEQKEVLFQNTRTKLIAHENKREGAALLGYQGDPDKLPTLAEHQFWVRWHTDTQVRHLAVFNDLADASHSVSEGEWQLFADRAVNDYYRRGEVPPQASRRPPDRAATPPPTSAPIETPEPPPRSPEAPAMAKPAPSAAPIPPAEPRPAPALAAAKAPRSGLPPRPSGPPPGAGSAKPGARKPKL